MSFPAKFSQDSGGKIKRHPSIPFVSTNCVPSSSRIFAEIDKEVTVLGVSDRIELWSTEKYDAYQNEEDESIEDIAGDLDF